MELVNKGIKFNPFPGVTNRPKSTLEKTVNSIRVSQAKTVLLNKFIFSAEDT